MLKVLLFVVVALFGVSLATIGSNLEEDDFRMLKERQQSVVEMENEEDELRSSNEGEYFEFLFLIFKYMKFPKNS